MVEDPRHSNLFVKAILSFSFAYKLCVVLHLVKVDVALFECEMGSNYSSWVDDFFFACLSVETYVGIRCFSLFSISLCKFEVEGLSTPNLYINDRKLSRGKDLVKISTS